MGTVEIEVHRDYGAAGQLTGYTLLGKYKILRPLPRTLDHAERNRSCCYVARGSCGGTFFVKAYDFRHDERMGKVDDMVDAGRQYISERDIHARVTQANLRRSTRHVGSGAVNVGRETAHYLISEWVDVNLAQDHSATRDRKKLSEKFCDIRQVCTGLIQLHRQGIAHQDVKPSNVMVDSDGYLKITDFGVSTCLDLPAPPSDTDVVPGDVNFAPFESLYAQRSGSWKRQRIGADMFLIGNFCLYSLTGLPVAQIACAGLRSELQPANASEDYKDIIPHLLCEITTYLGDVLEGAGVPDVIRPGVERVILELCHPDPSMRGDARERARGTPYELQRYESAFDRFRHCALRVEAAARVPVNA